LFFNRSGKIGVGLSPTPFKIQNFGGLTFLDSFIVIGAVQLFITLCYLYRFFLEHSLTVLTLVTVVTWSSKWRKSHFVSHFL